jgi:membrane protein implicated in regulation of membrane protease activity
MLYVWIAVLVVTVLLEALTSDLVAIWFVPAALVSLILSFFPAPIWLQLLVFIATGVVLVISTRPICRKLMKGRRERTNAEALIGKTCIVTEEIRNLDEVGEVKLGGLCWSARSAEQDRVIAVGEQVVVMEIQGVKLIVK